MNDLVSTYRVQLHKGFTLKDLSAMIDYLHELGIRTIYASPIFSATPGSEHGYDGTDPNSINPEIGNLGELRAISKKLKAYGMGWLQDIVPNHMAFHTGNRWLMNVLEKGKHSHYRKYFDIGEEEKIMVPFLGDTVENTVEKRELNIRFKNGNLVGEYFEADYPLNAGAYAMVLQRIGSEQSDLLASEIHQMLSHQSVDQWEEIKTRCNRLFAEGPVDLDKLKVEKEFLLEILDQQFYRLCHWQETDTRINYRRFFTVNGLICMNMQDETVFRYYHQLVKQLVDEKIFTGVRVDHVDGLYDPTEYLARLRALVGDDTYISIEKILAPGEQLPTDWKVEGNTGYDFLAMVNNLLTNPAGEKLLTRYYYSIANETATVAQQVRDKKAYILYHHMRGELENLCKLFLECSFYAEEQLHSFDPDALEKAIAGLLIHLPVYRFYGNTFPLNAVEQQALQEVFQQLKCTEPGASAAIRMMEDLFFNQSQDQEYNNKRAHFYKRCMQFSGPLMAKGVEDTLMYTFNRLVSRNEVGDGPGSFGIPAASFHRWMIFKREAWPYSMNATATHDTKRGEDFRARLNVLSDIPELWIEKVKEWGAMNKDLCINNIPDPNDEYFIYQNLLGAFPFSAEKDFADRLKTYLQKALREAKTHSSWTEPSEAYENGVGKFIDGLLDQNRPFWKSFTSFLGRVKDHGIVNSLVQLILKFTTPGIPDTYQGTELWHFSFVDPDNRRPVDYVLRTGLLQDRKSRDIKHWWEQRETGGIKIRLTELLLRIRRQHPSLLTAGSYIPLEVKGKYKDNILAFERLGAANSIIVIVPLHTAAIAVDPIKHDWEDTAVVINGEISQNLIDEEHYVGKELEVSFLFRELPFAILAGKPEQKKRKAGLLLHLTSLPTPFGIGDLGPSAHQFLKFLVYSGQSAWQMLPLNPTGHAQSYSPYSATSAMAGNPLLISPEYLQTMGLLEETDLNAAMQPNHGLVDYISVETKKQQLLEKAWRNFSPDETYRSFCERENDWLHDFALFTVLRELNNDRSWVDWDTKYRDRNKEALAELFNQQKEKIDFIKWQQYIFYSQWEELRRKANLLGITLIGDLPFYVSYDSADVWSNRSIFKLDADGKMLAMAGVPPDAFSEDGQLWGMPVFDWEKLTETGFKWWVQRLKKNIQLFDLIRLDHFRAFSAYWEVPARETTAKNGKWVNAPGEAFFNNMQQELEGLPFIAEDLGDIDQAVRDLRDQFKLPGMKVLQFAYSDDIGRSEFLPHQFKSNFVVYTGTHDNNTSRGWWENEADADTRSRVEAYAGKKLSPGEIADELCRSAYASVADLCIIPVQDILGLGEEARTNRPSSTENNWSWRLVPGQLDAGVERKLRQWTRLFNR